MATNEKKDLIRRRILMMDRPFRLSYLYVTLKGDGMNDKKLIIEVLDELVASGLVKQADVINDTIYRSSFLPDDVVDCA